MQIGEIVNKKLGAYPIGAWVPYYKDELNENTLKTIRESGINFVASTGCEKAELDLIKAAGLRALVNDDRVCYANVASVTKIPEYVSEYVNHDSVFGVFVWDEPSPTMMDLCGLLNRQVQKGNPELFGYVNLHPNYSDRDIQRDGLTYAEYLDYFVKTCNPKVISYDHYPFYKDGFHADEFFENLAAVRDCCNRHNLDFWSFLQSSSFYKNVTPTKAELDFQANAYIAYGAKGLLYFTYREVVHEDGFGYGLINRQGQKTELYEYATSLNAHIQSIGNTLLGLKHNGIAVFGNKYNKYATVSPDFTVTGGEFVCGVFDGSDGKYIYLVNTSLSGSAKAQIIYGGGKNKSITLQAGGGELIKLD